MIDGQVKEELETVKDQLEQSKLAEELAQERYKQQLGSIIEATEAHWCRSDTASFHMAGSTEQLSNFSTKQFQ